ncbi:hypothetical protein [Bacillus mycoides]|uniref:hypothetical protein n=1 Tax=Bacillus mycoides TaxID=1405 RepID=UPI003A7F76DE
MIQFENKETTLVNKWYGDTIRAVVEENDELSFEELYCLVSEVVENKIKEEITSIDEGFVSEFIGECFNTIDFAELTFQFFAIEKGKIKVCCEYEGGDFIMTTFTGTYREAVRHFTSGTQICTKLEVLG